MQPNLYTTQALIPKIFIIACKEGILLMPNGNPIAEARDNADTESDVDILIILEKIGNYSDEIARTSKLVSELSLKYDKTISRVFVSWHDWEEKETPFLLNTRKEAIAA